MGKSKVFVGLDADGYEHPDPTPVELPTRLRLPQRQVDRVRDIIRQELSLRAQRDGWESFEEADDFELPGEDPISPYEEVFEPFVVDSEVQQSAALKENGNDGANRKDDVVGGGRASGSVGAGRGAEGSGKAGGKAAESAGSEGSAGSSGEGDKAAPR